MMNEDLAALSSRSAGVAARNGNAAATSEMRERPILMSAPMVRAILDGRKTETRRVVKCPRGWEGQYPHLDPFAMPPAVWWWNGVHERVGVRQECPYGVPGDRLWVREGAWYDREVIGDIGATRCFFPGDHVRFQDGRAGRAPFETTADLLNLNGGLKKRPGIHMPRWASRITLEITDIRVQRLQDITRLDIVAEGWPMDDRQEGQVACVRNGLFSDDYIDDASIEWYADLWDSINGKGAWDANPFVWAITFRRIEAQR